MVKTSTTFICQQCGYQSPKWIGQCPNCGTWNSLVETTIEVRKSGSSARPSRNAQAIKLSEVKPKEYAARVSTGVGELDRVLGGGIVAGMVTLIAGEPGIGKSTLLLQIAARLGAMGPVAPSSGPEREPTSSLNAAGAGSLSGRDSLQSRHPSQVIYVAGEESVTQIANRAERLGIKGDNIEVLEGTDVDEILGKLSVVSSGLVIVDSIQTLTTSDLTGTAGSIGQVRECAARLTSWAKRTGTPVFLVGHVTKEGAIAGPRVLEHMVDTVLWFEGERSEVLRVLRTIKNRFGPTDEVGIFSMEERGLQEVTNPSEMFLGSQQSVPGSVVTVVMEGTRPLLVEIQALVVQTKLAFPKRVSQGIDSRRVELLIAVLTSRAGLPLWEYDIYVNVAGGIKIQEPGSDLAVALAIASAFRDKRLPKDTVAVGEVGLLGDIRPVLQLERRLKEAKRLGFRNTMSNREVRSVGEAIKKHLLD